MIFQPRSLQQRTLFFVLTPTLLLLISLSVAGFLFVRNILLDEWGKTAIVKLQRTAHLIDMELRKPKDLLLLLQSSDDPDATHQIFSQILKRIEGLEGVVGVNVKWPKDYIARGIPSGMGMGMEMMERYRLGKFEVSAPIYNSKLNNRTVSLVSEFKNQGEKVVGRVEVIISTRPTTFSP